MESSAVERLRGFSDDGAIQDSHRSNCLFEHKSSVLGSQSNVFSKIRFDSVLIVDISRFWA
jgi:hypothetical protein